MDHEAVLLTLEGVEKLKQEKERLINVERPRVIEELQLARSQGDLSEINLSQVDSNLLFPKVN